MNMLEILAGTGIMLFIILIMLIFVLVFKATDSNVRSHNPSPKEDLEKIKAQIGE